MLFVIYSLNRARYAQVGSQAVTAMGFDPIMRLFEPVSTCQKQFKGLFQKKAPFFIN